MASGNIVAENRQVWQGSDSLQVMLCGSGGDVPDAQRAGSCVIVAAAGRAFLVDAGPGSWRNVAASGLPAEAIEGVLLTHFHADHIGDLGEVLVHSWSAGRRRALDIFGPPGVEEVVAGMARAYAWDRSYRVAAHGAHALPPAGGRWNSLVLQLPAAASSSEESPSTLVLKEKGLQIHMFRVLHGSARPAVGYRFDYLGRSVVISGDASEGSAVALAAAGADLLLHNAVPEPAEGAAVMQRKAAAAHAKPVDALAAAHQAKVGRLVLTHLPISGFGDAELSALLESDSEDWFGKVLLGKDGMHFRLPVDSDEIELLR